MGLTEPQLLLHSRYHENDVLGESLGKLNHVVKSLDLYCLRRFGIISCRVALPEVVLAIFASP